MAPPTPPSPRRDHDKDMETGYLEPKSSPAAAPRKRSSLKNPSFRAATATASQNSLNEGAAYTEPYAQLEVAVSAKQRLRSSSVSRSRDFLNKRSSRSKYRDFLNQRSRSRSRSRDALIQVATRIRFLYNLRQSFDNLRWDGKFIEIAKMSTAGDRTQDQTATLKNSNAS